MLESNLLMEDIECLRRKLTQLGYNKGYTHEETIKVSQELDCLLNKLNEIEGKSN